MSRSDRRTHVGSSDRSPSAATWIALADRWCLRARTPAALAVQRLTSARAAMSRRVGGTPGGSRRPRWICALIALPERRRLVADHAAVSGHLTRSTTSPTSSSSPKRGRCRRTGKRKASTRREETLVLEGIHYYDVRFAPRAPTISTRRPSSEKLDRGRRTLRASTHRLRRSRRRHIRAAAVLRAPDDPVRPGEREHARPAAADAARRALFWRR